MTYCQYVINYNRSYVRRGLLSFFSPVVDPLGMSTGPESNPRRAEGAARSVAGQLYSASSPAERVDAWRAYVESPSSGFAADAAESARLVAGDDVDGLTRHAGRYARAQAAAASRAIRDATSEELS